VLESTFVSVRRMLGRYLLPPFVARHPMRTDLVLRSYGGPVLVLHGRRDSIIPFEHGRRLSEMSDRATLVPTDSGHNDLVGDWTWYTGELLSFAEGAVSSGPRTDAPSAGSGAPAPSSPSGSRP
jgi:pimeloyl-ACP methyl ester carboxylesterase